MDMRTAFPSRFFKPQDFDSNGKSFTIGQITLEALQARATPVMYFRGVEKGLILNQERNNTLMALPGFGYDSDGWIGKEIVIFCYTGVFNGQPQLRLGVRANIKGSAPAVQKPRELTKDEFNDEVPF